ncbi:RHS repeat domain-containing protein, partial [Desulfobotulus pelophilus]|uniref:RHS repeat domain-containing protein n=1 Tax=Desulfobotulus pelophilus TaxID=2823377 RepID=UPI0026E54769
EGLVAELDGSGREIRSFGWKPQGIWGTDPLYLKEAGHYYWYHNDHLGTPQMLTASSGAVVWEAKYESFGRALVDGGARVKNPLRFPGQYEDEETGLHYNWWRYYDPEVGRYLRVDPIGLEGGDVNLYAYAFSNPENYIDAYGLMGTKIPRDRIPREIKRYFVPPNPPPCDYFKYCQDSYNEMVNDCTFIPTLGSGMCLERARHWYIQCQNIANDVGDNSRCCDDKGC